MAQAHCTYTFSGGWVKETEARQDKTKQEVNIYYVSLNLVNGILLTWIFKLHIHIEFLSK